MHWIVAPNAQIPCVPLFGQLFLRYKVVKNRKCTELHQTYLKKLTVPDIQWLLTHTPPTSTFSSILLYDQPFARYRVVKNGKCTEWPQADLKHLTLKSTLHTLNTYYLTVNCASVLLYDQSFSRYKVVENRKCTGWNQTDLEHSTVKSTLYVHWILTSKAQISLRFALRCPVFEITAVFGFPIHYNGEHEISGKVKFLKFVKKLKI